MVAPPPAWMTVLPPGLAVRIMDRKGAGKGYPGLVKLLTASVAVAARRERRLTVPKKPFMMMTTNER